jgi:hypothetical protein
MKLKRPLILSIVLLTGILSAGCGGGKKALAGKAQELMDTQVTEKLDAGARIRDKVAVVDTYPGIPVSLEGFHDDGTVDNLSAYFFSPRRKAQTIDEIDTLVKVICRKGDAIARSSPAVYASVCDVSLIDFKTKTLFAKKSFVNNSLDKGTSPINPDVAYTPSEDIKAYLRAFSTYE